MPQAIPVPVSHPVNGVEVIVVPSGSGGGGGGEEEEEEEGERVREWMEVFQF